MTDPDPPGKLGLAGMDSRPSLNSSQLRRFDLALRELYVHADDETFPERLLTSVRGLVGSDMTCYTELNPLAGRVRNVADPEESVVDALLPILAELQDQHPRLHDFATTQNTSARAVSDYVSAGEWRRRDLYNHFYGALGFEDQISIMMPAQEGIMIGLALNRSRRGFSQGDHELLDLLRPHMVLAWQNALAVTRLEDPDGSPAAALDFTVLRLKNDGSVWHGTQRAWELLRRYVTDEDAASTAALPGRIRKWVRRHLDAPARDGPGSSRFSLRIRTAEGMLSLRLVRELGVEGWLLILRERSLQGRRGKTGDVPPRLRRVLDRLLQGDSEKEVAAYLGLSRHTIHEYVKQLYRSLGVSSRGELMARWIERRDGHEGR